jgi:FtsP/CotA-like multicopper oxidase with cupredoxin domain
MDGVPYLTQCPIPYSSTFRYAFHADDAGTHFYHSHSGQQKIDGLYGALIVREPIENVPNRRLYDFDRPEHVILTTDWMHQMAENHLPGMLRRSTLSKSMLINGRGRYYDVSSLNHLEYFSHVLQLLADNRNARLCSMDNLSC